MKITDRSIGRPVTTVMVYAGLLILGVISIINVPLEFMPEADFPEIDMEIPYPASSPLEVQKRITKKLENAISTMPGIEKMTSRSSQTGAHMHVWFKSGSNVDFEVLEVRERIDQVRDELPDDLDRIWIWKFDSESIPIIIMGVNADKWTPEVNEFVDRDMARDLRRADGVANVEIWGQEERRVLVEVDRSRLDKFGVSMIGLYRALLANNVTLDAGQVEHRGLNHDVRIVGQALGPEEIRDFPITENVKVGDVADVRFDYTSTMFRGRINRKRAAVVFIRKESGANTVETCRRVRRTLESINASPRLRELGVETKVFFDQSAEISLAVSGLRKTGIEGAALAFLVLLIFLRDVRSTAIISVAIPSSIMIAVLVMYLVLDMSFNMISLSGLMLGVGMLVDNSIVAMEAIYSRIQQGLPPHRAAKDGLKEVGTAISVATTTTLIVFLPLLFVSSGSETVIIMREFGTVLCLSIAASLLVALTLIPLLASFLGAGSAKTRTPGWFVVFRTGYMRLVGAALDRRKRTLAVVVGFLLLTLLPFSLTEKEYVPQTAMRLVRTLVWIDRAKTLDEIDRMVDEIEEKLWRHRQEWGVDSMTAVFNRNFIEINMFLPVYETPKMPRNEVKERAGKVLETEADWPGVTFDMENMGFEGAPAGGINVRVLGENPQVLYQVAESLRERLKRVKGIKEVKPLAREAEREIGIRMNRELAAVYGVDPTMVAYEIAYGIRGTRAGWVKYRDRQVDVVMQLREKDRENIPALLNYPLRNDRGQTVRLGGVAAISPQPVPRSIHRENRRMRLKIPLEYEGRDLFKLKERITEALKDFPMPRGYKWTMGDQFDKVREAFVVLLMALGLAVALVFIVMVAQFESFFLPFVIMFSIPFALTGAYWSLFLTGNTLNIISGAGMLLLTGIVVNNAIVLVDRVHNLRKQGYGPRESLIRGSRDRFRPILMTAITTMVGLFPMALGANDQGRMIYSPLAIAVLGGLFTSTLLIPVVIPTIYSVSDSAVARLKRWWAGVGAAARK